MSTSSFFDSNTFEDAFCHLQNFQLQGIFCDVTIRCHDDKTTEFTAHKVILAAKSMYFYAMFTTGLMEKNEEVITLKGVTSNAFKALMSYAYSGKVEIDPENIEDVLEAAHMLQFENVQDACFEFLRNNIDCANCIGISYLAQKYDCKKALRDAEEFLRQNFRDVTRMDEFLEMEFNHVVKLISSDELNVTDESEVYTAIMNWTKHCESTRTRYLGQLLHYLRVPLLTRKFLIDILAKEELIVGNRDCRKFLLNALDYHLLPERRDQFQAVKSGPRESVTRKILVIAGENRSGVLKTTECYDVGKFCWETKPSMAQARKHCAAVFLDGMVYVAGGIGMDGTDLDTVEQYDPSTCKWTFVAKLNECKGAIALAVLEGWLYAIGGSHGGSALKTVERYDPVSNYWTQVQSMRFPRSNYGVAAHGGKLHAIGGYCGISEIEHCEAYDPLHDRWKDIADLNKARMNHGVVVHSDRIYAIGGKSPNSVLDSIEKYNSGLNMWLIIKHTLDPRAGASVALVTTGNDESAMYVVGGLDTSHICHNSVKTIELNSIDYNITNSIGMLEPRAFGAVVTY